MDVWNIGHYKRGPGRAYALEMMKDKLVRGEVVFRYTFIDELLTEIICDFYFHRPKTGSVSYRQLWKTKRFRLFVHYLMDEMFPLKKLSMVEAIKAVPTDVSSAIKRINDARNALAHSFFPQNRRRYMADKKVDYKGSNIFTREGVEKFHRDYEIAQKWLAKKVFG